jgi:hypothetical protein
LPFYASANYNLGTERVRERNTEGPISSNEIKNKRRNRRNTEKI